MAKTGQLKVWLIDDSPDHHAVAAETVATLEQWSLSGFLRGHEAVDAYADLVERDHSQLPDVVLMDFYLGDERGDQVTAQLRRLEPSERRTVIVGYSSVADASRQIVASGADLTLRKHHNDAGINPTLRAWLANFEQTRG